MGPADLIGRPADLIGRTDDSIGRTAAGRPPDGHRMYSMFCKVLYGQLWSDLMIWSALILAVRRPSGGRPAAVQRLSGGRPAAVWWPSGVFIVDCLYGLSV